MRITGPKMAETKIDITKPVLWVAACALIDADGRVLVTQRPVGKDHAGLWEFPGGKIEAGELPEQTLVRELYEELSVEPCLDCLEPLTFASHVYPDFHLIMPTYVCRQWDGFVRPREGQGTAWKFADEIVQMDLVAADIPLAQQLAARLPRGKRFLV